MKAVATVPSLYPVLVDLNVIPSILGLLGHDNTDIAVSVVDLMQVPPTSHPFVSSPRLYLSSSSPCSSPSPLRPLPFLPPLLIE